MSQEICKYAAFRAEIYLNFRSSEIAAIAATIALNISLNASICKEMELEHLNIVKGNRCCPLDWWTPKVCNELKIDLCTLAPKYEHLLGQLNT